MFPLVTIVTPSYNSSKTIFGTIDSVLAQSYPNIQYIICDDASDDFESNAIIDYIHSNNTGNIVDYIVTKNDTNLGVVKNLNLATSKAIGKYLFTVSADDEFFDECVISQWVARFEETQASIITAKRAVFDENFSEFLYSAPSQNEIETITNSTPQELFEKMCGYNLIFGCCTARTKKSFDEMGGYDEKYPIIEDYPSNLKLLRNGIPIEFWDRTVIKYRIGGISSQGKLSDKYLSVMDDIFYSEIYPYCQNRLFAKAKYSTWKNEAIWMREKNLYISTHSYNNGILSRFRFIFYMAIKHPILFIKILRTKLWISNK